MSPGDLNYRHFLIVNLHLLQLAISLFYYCVWSKQMHSCCSPEWLFPSLSINAFTGYFPVDVQYLLDKIYIELLQNIFWITLLSPVQRNIFTRLKWVSFPHSLHSYNFHRQMKRSCKSCRNLNRVVFTYLYERNCALFTHVCEDLCACSSLK